jgi:hypothetical protein
MGDELEIAGAELDWLDRKLREDATYVDDAGFSAAVVRKLPVRRTTRSVRAMILILAAVLASGVSYLLSGGGFVFEALARMSILPPVMIYGAALAIGVLLVGLGAFAALKRSDAL